MSGCKCQGTTPFLFHVSILDSNHRRRRAIVPMMETGLARVTSKKCILLIPQQLSISLIYESCLHSPQLKSALEHPVQPGTDVARYWAGKRAENGRVKELGRKPGLEET